MATFLFLSLNFDLQHKGASYNIITEGSVRGRASSGASWTGCILNCKDQYIVYRIYLYAPYSFINDVYLLHWFDLQLSEWENDEPLDKDVLNLKIAFTDFVVVDRYGAWGEIEFLRRTYENNELEDLKYWKAHPDEVILCMIDMTIWILYIWNKFVY